MAFRPSKYFVETLWSLLNITSFCFRTQWSMNNSCRRLAILSKDLLTSEYVWDLWKACESRKLKMAIRTADKDNVLAMLRDSENLAVIYRYIKKFSYWKVDKKNFYQKLVYFLPHKKMPVTRDKFLSEFKNRLKNCPTGFRSSRPQEQLSQVNNISLNTV